MTSLKKKFLGLDFLGNSFRFTIKDRDKFSTYLGICLSINIIFALIPISIKFAFNYHNKSSPKIVEHVSFSDKSPYIDLMENRLMPILFYQYNNNFSLATYEEVKNNVTLLASQEKWNPLNKDNKLIININKTYYEMIPCTEEIFKRTKFNEIYDKIPDLKNSALKSGICFNIPDDKSTIVNEEPVESVEYYEFNIYVAPCLYEKDPDECTGEIRNGDTILTHYQMPIIKYGNFTDPIQYKLFYHKVTQITAGFSKYTCYLTYKLIVKDDLWDFFDPVVKSEAFELVDVFNTFYERPSPTKKCLKSDFKNPSVLLFINFI